MLLKINDFNLEFLFWLPSFFAISFSVGILPPSSTSTHCLEAIKAQLRRASMAEHCIVVSRSLTLLLMKTLKCFSYQNPPCTAVWQWHCFETGVRTSVGYTRDMRVSLGWSGLLWLTPCPRSLIQKYLLGVSKIISISVLSMQMCSAPPDKFSQRTCLAEVETT